MIEIKKGIPVPTHRAVGGRPGRYPFADMGMDDCFDVGVKEGEQPDVVVRRMRVAATSWKKRASAVCSFAVRIIDSENVVRVWKTAPRASKAA